MNKKRKFRLFIIYSITLIFIILFFIIPLPYYGVFPGELINLGEVVSIDTNFDKDKEHFFAISSNVYENPYSKFFWLTTNNFEINLFIFIFGKLFPYVELYKIPTEYENITSEEIKKYQYKLLQESLKISKYLAIQYLSLNDTQVNISFGQLAGSSGSLMTTLEIINQLSRYDIIRGRKIAGTGELNYLGEVLSVGNIAQKIYTAEKNNVDIMIIPEVNIKNAPQNPSFKLIYVTNLSQAIEYLQT